MISFCVTTVPSSSYVVCTSGEILIFNTEFAFYINRNGWRARPQFIIHWEGIPSSFGEAIFKNFG